MGHPVCQSKTQFLVLKKMLIDLKAKLGSKANVNIKIFVTELKEHEITLLNMEYEDDFK